MLPSLERLNVLTVASPSSMAATISPFSATFCSRTTTQSPSVIAALIIESPTTRSRNSVPSPTICLFSKDRATGCDAADHRHVGRLLRGDVHRRLFLGDALIGRALLGADRRMAGQADLDRARPADVAGA